MQVSRHFVRVGEREVHYRRAGSGPPFVLFHVSPQSSAFVIPALLPLADRYTLIALDTPGYGESDPLIQTAPSLADYAETVLETLDALGIGRAPFYGSHTGANVAVELARRAPERVAALVLDGLSLSTPDIAQDRTDHYAPPFVPTAGGEHLAWAWQHTRDQLLFWPWYEPHKANRLNGPMKNADYLHDVVLGKIAAADYWLGYRAAFNHDSRDAISQLSVDTFFVTAQADEHTAVERSLADLPANIRFVDTDEAGQLDAIRKILAQVHGDEAARPPADPVHRRNTYRSYVDSGGGERLVRRAGVMSGRPLVLLHGGMRSSALLTDQATAMASSRPVLSIDIAGNGDSDALDSENPSLDSFAQDIRQVIKGCGLDEFDLYGESVGATLAMEVTRQASDRVGKLILDRPEMPDADLRKDLIAHVAPAIEAQWDGTHFLTAWHMLRDAAMFWPWYRCSPDGLRDIEPEVEPVALQRRLLAWLKGRLTYGAYIRAGISANSDQLVSATRQPVLVIGTVGDILEDHASRTAAALPAARLLLVDGTRPPPSAMTVFLDE
jgi:pimeloyl-ACP methyl ester carboxylesterase